jgi:hypothetical protein
MDWIDLAQDRAKWRGLVKAVMKLRSAQKTENFVSERLLASQE